MDGLGLVVLAAGALLVRVAQMLGAMGLTRAKNAASGGFRSLADLCVASLAFWCIGAALYFQQNNALLGFRADHFIGWSGLSANWFSILSMVLLATGIVAPALAERSKLIVPLVLSAILGGILVPMVAFWTWRGWLATMGFVDLAGAAAIHLTPALCAATAALLIGPRDGKYNRDGSSNMIPGHSVPLILASTMLALGGWVPYVMSRATAVNLSIVPANVMVSAAAGGVVALIAAWIRFGKADVLLTCVGLMSGLVSITAAAGAVGTPGAFVIGAVAGLAIPWLTVKIDLNWKIDDPAGVIAIHGVGGVWALLASAALPPNTVIERLRLIGIHSMGIIVVAITVVSLTGSILLLLRAVTGLRSKEADEYDGLDLAEHDINAHPDFQQTMIKSYHLREA
jgi:Amt family ammonium transporter